MAKVKRVLGTTIILALLVGSSAPFLMSMTPVAAQTENPYLVNTFVDEDGNQIDKVIVPGRPPEIKAEAVDVPEPNIQMGINTLTGVPAFDWSYGCSATSAAMLFGYYDRTGYSNMYAGPTNSGVCPLDNSTWGHTWWVDEWYSECPLSATHQGKDGRTIRGHVDDYWIDFDDPGPDPWIVNGWTEHTHGDCTGDFMGTNQSAFDSRDGSTTFYNYTNGAPLYDYTDCEPAERDGCHGLRLFAESRGYSVITNFNQYIYGYNGNTMGFTFAQYTDEIDAGRPVLIHIAGHTMLGYGYNTTGNIVYIHDTWDHSDHQMTWGGTYGGDPHYGVTVIQLASTPLPDLIVESLTHLPVNPTTADTITFTAVVKNVGSAAAGASTLEFRVGGEFPYPTYPVPALAPGANHTVQRQEVLTAQNYLNTATADINDEVTESNETNNQKTDSYTVTQVSQPSVTTNDATNITTNSATLNGYLNDLGTASTVYVSFENGLATVNAQTENPYLVNTFVDEDGNQIDKVIVPGRPPEIKVEAVDVPEPNIQMGINTLTGVPAFDWSYGCSATSAAMLFGHYDRTGYSNMYTGPTNGGVCPLDNSTWGHTWWVDEWYSECPLSATHQGKDGRTTRGHVDDYWINYLDPGPDPWIVNGWAEHTHGDCTGDFMGTNQSAVSNTDGETIFYWYTNGAPLYDYTDCEPAERDGCHGLRLFAESRGYSVITNFSQYIYGYNGNTLGFTFAQYTDEIDAGRPVLIHIEGHTMLGYGYNTTGNIVYIHDTWDHSDHQMTWGGSYGGDPHYGVTVIQLASVGAIVYVSFEYGLTTAYGNETTPQAMTTTGPFSFDLGGLSPNTTYHFRAKAAGNGTSYGLDKSFTTSGAGAVTVSINAPAEVAPNSNFTADVDISQVDNFDSASYNVSFNASILRLDNVTSGQLNTTVIPVDIWNEISPGTYTIIQNVPGLSGVSGSGTLAVLHFHVVGTECQTSPIDLSNGILGDNLAQQIPATWIDDSVHVSTSAVLPGDANGDGVVNNLDITKVERIIVGLDTETPGADANQDGVVNNLDITKIERIIVGLD